MEMCQGRFRLDIMRRILSPEGGWALQEGSAQSTRPDRGQEGFGQRSQAQGGIPGALQDQELDSRIHGLP